MSDSERGKLFVGGISRETDEHVLREYFRRYGDVLSSVVAKDPNTKCSRGFGFVMFSEPSSADKALGGKHEIKGRIVDVKRAIPKGESQQNQIQREYDNCRVYGGSSNSVDNQFRTRKIFVGGLPACVTQEEFRRYFERFGRITDVVVMHDNSTNRPRGFGFITFDSEDVVDRIVQKNFYELAGKSVEVKKAIPKDCTKTVVDVNDSRNNDGSNSVSSLHSGYWQPPQQQNQMAGGFGYGYYPTQGYYPQGYGFNGYYGAMYPMGGYFPVRYPMGPMVPVGGSWNEVGMGRVAPIPNGYAPPYYNMNGNVGVPAPGFFNGSNDARNEEGTAKPFKIGWSEEASPWVNNGGRNNGYGHMSSR